MPEKPEEWTNFEVPEPYFTKSNGHEDKIMVAKWTFLKPELTYLHLKQICGLLEEHYFTLQMLPVLKLLELFSKDVLADSVQERTHVLARCRVLMNLGLKEQANELTQQIDQTG